MIPLNEQISRTKELMGVRTLNENIGQEMLATWDETTPEATETDYNDFLECLEMWYIDPDVMDNANNFVRMQMHVLGKNKDGEDISDTNWSGHYTMKMGLIGWNLVQNGYDIYNRRSNEPSTCAMDMMEKFGIGDNV